MSNKFRKFAQKIASIAGSPQTFVIAVGIIVVWASVGSFFNYSTNWQLFVNTTTTIVTFLMVFLIQNTQNRDTKAIHLKLDELIKSIKGAREELIDIEEQEDNELEQLQEEFQKLHDKYIKENGKSNPQKKS